MTVEDRQKAILARLHELPAEYRQTGRPMSESALREMEALSEEYTANRQVLRRLRDQQALMDAVAEVMPS